MKMTRLQWFEAGYGTTAVELGIISPDVFIKYIRYKVYQDYRSKKHDHGTAMELAAEECRVNAATIWRDIQFMNGKNYPAQLTQEERTERARKAANGRWKKDGMLHANGESMTS